LSLGPASRLLGIDPDTLRRWADQGRVASWTTPGGHRRFDRSALERLVTARRTTGGQVLSSLGGSPERLAKAYRRHYATDPGTVGRGGEAGAADADRDAHRRDGRRLIATRTRERR
jgi:excisionase family DNA binding protein